MSKVVSIEGGRVIVVGPTKVETLQGVEEFNSRELEQVKMVLKRVYVINEEGGPGSRRLVKDLLEPYVNGGER